MDKLCLKDQVPKRSQSCEIANLRQNIKNMSSSENHQIQSDSWGLRVQDHQEKSHKELMCDPFQEIREETPPNLTNRNSSKNTSQNAEKKNARDKRIWHKIKMKMSYELLSHIRLQALHKNHKSWMAKSSHKDLTLSSLPQTKTSPK